MLRFAESNVSINEKRYFLWGRSVFMHDNATFCRQVTLSCIKNVTHSFLYIYICRYKCIQCVPNAFGSWKRICFQHPDIFLGPALTYLIYRASDWVFLPGFRVCFNHFECPSMRRSLYVCFLARTLHKKLSWPHFVCRDCSSQEGNPPVPG